MDWLLFLFILFIINIVAFSLFYGLDGVLKNKNYEIYNKEKLKIIKYFIVNSKMKLKDENNKVYYNPDYKFTVTKNVLKKQIANYILMFSVIVLIVTYQITLNSIIYLLIISLLALNFVFLLYLIIFFMVKTI